MSSDLFRLERYTIRRSLLRFPNADFHVVSPSGRALAHWQQRGPAPGDVIRVFSDAAHTAELLRLERRRFPGFASGWDVVDARSGAKIGAARRKEARPTVRGAWDLLDRRDRPIARLHDAHAGMALLARYTSLVPQSFRLRPLDTAGQALLLQRPNPFLCRLEIRLPADVELDRRMVFATGVLVTATTGRRQSVEAAQTSSGTTNGGR